MLTLSHVLEALTGHQTIGDATIITDAVIDSRLVTPGCLFIAIPGNRTDGHQYVPAAFEQGAAFALIEQDLPGLPTLDLRHPLAAPPAHDPTAPLCLRVEHTLTALQTIAAFWRQQLAHLKVIGITGSVGKTTTKELVAAILRERYNVLKTQGNLNNEIGLPLTLLRLTSAHQVAVLEMGFYQIGEIAFLCDLARPEVGIINNVYAVHLERAGSIENIQQGKGELIAALPPSGVAILNHDEPRVLAMRDRNPHTQFLTYGLHPQADLRADHIEGLGLNGIRFRLHYHHETLHITAPLLGRHSVHTALRAIAAGLVLNLNWDTILAGLHSPHAQNQLRLVAVRGPNGSLLLDDTYNASPESTIAALNLLADIDARRRVAVLGDMLELGEYETRGHQVVGARAAQVVDLLFTVGERAQIIARTALASGLPAAQIHHMTDTTRLLADLCTTLTAGDVILIKGSRATRLDLLAHQLELEAAQ